MSCSLLLQTPTHELHSSVVLQLTALVYPARCLRVLSALQMRSRLPMRWWTSCTLHRLTRVRQQRWRLQQQQLLLHLLPLLLPRRPRSWTSNPRLFRRCCRWRLLPWARSGQQPALRVAAPAAPAAPPRQSCRQPLQHMASVVSAAALSARTSLAQYTRRCWRLRPPWKQQCLGRVPFPLLSWLRHSRLRWRCPLWLSSEQRPV